VPSNTAPVTRQHSTLTTQDIQFWPHTNFTPLTIGVYLNDVTEDMGPMKV
jgi:hypothetical protein